MNTSIVGSREEEEGAVKGLRGLVEEVREGECRSVPEEVVGVQKCTMEEYREAGEVLEMVDAAIGSAREGWRGVLGVVEVQEVLEQRMGHLYREGARCQQEIQRVMEVTM